MSFPSGHSTVFAIVDNAAALAWVANLGCIELHTWHSRVPGDRAARLPADRPRPDHRRAVAVRPRDRARRARGDGRARARARTRRRRARPGCTSWRRSGRSCRSPTCAGSRRRSREEVERRIGDQARRDDDLARRRPGRRVRRLRPERPRPHDRVRRTRSGRRRTRASRRRCAGTRSRPSTRRRSRVETMPAGSPTPATRCAACGAARRRCGALRAARARASRRPDSSRESTRRSRAFTVPHPDRRESVRSDASGEAEECLDRRRVRVARRPQLAPGAVARILVVAPADQLRAVAEAIALHLVVAHLDDELRPHGAPPRARRVPQRFGSETCQLGRLLDAAAAPSPRPRPASSRRPRTSRRSRARRPRGRAEQQRRDLRRDRPSSARRRRRSRRSCAPSP